MEYFIAIKLLQCSWWCYRAIKLCYYKALKLYTYNQIVTKLCHYLAIKLYTGSSETLYRCETHWGDTVSPGLGTAFSCSS